MEVLPYEIVNVIINFINPNLTFLSSLVCKNWRHLLDNRYSKKTKKLVLFNDSYYMATIDISLTVTRKLSRYIDKITTHNCLNMLAYNISNKNIYFESKYLAQFFKISLIKQFCATNNINIIQCTSLIFVNELSPKIIVNRMLKWCLINESYEIADFILCFGPIIYRWVMHILKYNICINSNIKKALDYLIKNKVMNLPEFYREMLLLKSSSVLCRDIVKYIKYEINENIRKYIKLNLNNYASFVIYYVN